MIAELLPMVAGALWVAGFVWAVVTTPSPTAHSQSSADSTVVVTATVVEEPAPGRSLSPANRSDQLRGRQ